MTTTRTLLAAIALSLLVPGGVPAAAEGGLPREPGGVPLTLSPYTFETRDGRTVEAQRGAFRVPENRRSARGREIELVFVRFPTTSPTPTAPIVYLAGGPGGSGITTARGTRFDLFQSLRSVADVIAFDQRGTGDSHTLPPCSRSSEVPLEVAATRAVVEAAAEEAARFCAAEWRRRGVDLDAYNTEESADDLEALRRALGVPKISLWSISYGSHLAMAALRRHPGSIERVVLAGPEGPDHTVKHPKDGQELLEALARRIAADAEASEAFPDFLGSMGRVLERLEKEPAKVSLPQAESREAVTTAVTAWDIRQLAAGMLRGPETMAYLPMFFRDLEAGDFSSVTRYLPRARRVGLSAMYSAMDCASGISPRRSAKVRREARRTLLQDAINGPYEALCRGLGVRDLGAGFRAPLRTSVPALFISGTFDGRTPVANAADLLGGFADASHLILEGAGHSDPLFLSSPQIETWLLDFFRGRELPQEHRIAVPMPPFQGLPSTASP